MNDYEELGYSMFYGVVAVLVSLAFVFLGVCILIFCISRSRTKKFIEQRTQESYRKANGFYVASIVFTVFITMFTLSGVAGFFTTLFNLLDDPEPDMLVWYIIEVVEFAMAVTAMVLGITALAAFGKVKPLYAQLFPPQPTYYGNAAMQNWQYNRQTYYQYPQQNNQQYGQQYNQQYGQQYNQYSQQNFPQNPHQAYQQPRGTGRVYTQNTVYGTPDPSAPREKICPHCGVVNDAKNQECMFCNKPM